MYVIRLSLFKSYYSYTSIQELPTMPLYKSEDVFYVKATDNMKIGVAQANIERNHAKQQVMRLKQELDQSDRERNAVSFDLKHVFLYLLTYFHLFSLFSVNTSFIT